MSQKIIIIGGGPAGIEAALTAAKAGSQVTLISNTPLGGRAGWHSLLPSKVWLTAANTLGLFQEADKLGVSVSQHKTAYAKILERIRETAVSWNGQQAKSLKSVGVEIISGTATFSSPTSIQINDKSGTALGEMTADSIIVASGSVPIFPANMKPDGKRVLAPRFASHLAQLPASIIVVGGGATGSEFAYLFNRMGVHVTWIVDGKGVLPDMQPSSSQFLAKKLVEQGITLVSGQAASHIDHEAQGIAVVMPDGTRHRAEMAFLAIGRKPDWSHLNLSAAEIDTNKGLALDAFGRSTNRAVYLIGDAAGAPMIANRALAQARVAARHAAGLPTPPFRPDTIIAAIFTEPEAAQVGDYSNQAQLATVRVPYTKSLKAHLLPNSDGFLELVYDRKTRIIRGGTAVGLHAADILAPVALAIQQSATTSDLAALYPAHPTLSELAFIAARQ